MRVEDFKRNQFFICDRSGRKYPIAEAVIEPGTGLMVHRSESDGMYNAVDHPLNFPPPHRREPTPLKNSRNGSKEVVFLFLLDEDGAIIVDEWGNPILLDDGS